MATVEQKPELLPAEKSFNEIVGLVSEGVLCPSRCQVSVDVPSDSRPVAVTAKITMLIDCPGEGTINQQILSLFSRLKVEEE